MSALLDDWIQSIPCNDNFEVPLLCRPNFKDLVTIEKGFRLPVLASNPNDYTTLEGAMYYNSGDERVYFRESGSWTALATAGAGISFPIQATSAALTTQVLTSQVTPDSDITFALNADGTLVQYDGAGVLESQFGYDPLTNDWFFETTSTARNGRLKLASVFASRLEATGDLTIKSTGGSIYFEATNFILGNSNTWSVGALNIETGNFGRSGGELAITGEPIKFESSSPIDCNDLTLDKVKAVGLKDTTGASSTVYLSVLDADTSNVLIGTTIGSTNGKLQLGSIIAGTSVSTSTLIADALEGTGDYLDVTGQTLGGLKNILFVDGVAVTEIAIRHFKTGEAADRFKTYITGDLHWTNGTDDDIFLGKTPASQALSIGITKGARDGTLNLGALSATGTISGSSIQALGGGLQQYIGNATTLYKVSSTLYKQLAVFGSSSGGGVQTVWSFEIPAGTFTAYGDGMRIYVAGRTTASSNAKLLRFTVNSTNYDSAAFTISVQRPIIFEAVLTYVTAVSFNLSFKIFENETINEVNMVENGSCNNWSSAINTFTLSVSAGALTNDMIIRHSYVEIF